MRRFFHSSASAAAVGGTAAAKPYAAAGPTGTGSLRVLPYVGALLAGLVLGGVSLVASPLWALVGLLGIAATVLIANRPEFGLLAMVVVTSGLVDSEQLPLLSIGPASLHVTDILLFYLLGILAVRALAARGFHTISTPLDLPLLAFYGALLFSAAVAVARFSVDATNVLRQLRPLTYYLAFFVVTNLVRNRKQLNTLITGLIVIGLVASMALLVQVMGERLFGWQLQLAQVEEYTLTTAGREYPGIVRTYMQADRLVYPMLLVSIAGLILGRPATDSGAEREPGKLSGMPVRTAILAIQIVLLGTGVFLSFQRNYWVTFALATGLMFVLVTGSARLRAVVWAMVALVVLTVLINIPGTGIVDYVIAAEDRLIWGLQPETLEEDSSTQWRLMEMQYGMQTVFQRPLFGIGMGNTYRPWVPSDAYFRPDDPSLGLRWYLHNAYLWVAVMAGAVGLLPFLLLYGIFVIRGLRRWRHLQPGAIAEGGALSARAVVLGLTVAVVGQLVSNLVAPNFLQSWSLVVFAIILGVNEVVYRLDSELPDAESH